jgi:hypothetical protein
MRGGATELNESQKWATSKTSLRTTGLDNISSNVRMIDEFESDLGVRDEI